MDKDKLRARLAELCAEPGFDDGEDPRWDRREPRRSRGKAAGRIVGATREILAALDDPRLADAHVIDVEISDAGTVATVVVEGGTPEAWDVAAAFLREALAAQLRRRRIPAIRIVQVGAHP